MKQRYRSGKRPFRTYHKNNFDDHGANFPDKIEFDETDNDELTIFESWVSLALLLLYTIQTMNQETLKSNFQISRFAKI